MKHHDNKRTLGRDTDQRRALLRSLAISLIENGKIKTTEAKAKELRPFIEKLVTKGKDDTVASRRVIQSRLSNPNATKKLVDEISSKYKTQNGGYTRITKLPIRLNSAAKMAQIEFV